MKEQEVEDVLMKYQWDFCGLETNQKIYNELGKPNINVDLNINLGINDWFRLLGINKEIVVNKVEIRSIR